MNEPDNRDARLDAAYRATPRHEPPAALDERIRAAARRAVSANPQSAAATERARARRSWAARWRVPVSLAATVVIVVTVTVMMREEEGRRARLDTPMNGAPPAVAPERVPPAEAGRADERAAPPAIRVPKPQAPVLEQQRATAATPAPAPQAPEKLESPSASGALSKERENRQVEQTPAQPPPSAVQAAPAAPAAGPPPAPARPAPLAPPPPAAREMMRSAPSGAAETPTSRDRTFADRPARMERGTAAPAAAEAKTRTPEAWIEEIRRLKAQGREAEAITELAEFRNRYPDYSLPPDLAK